MTHEFGGLVKKLRVQAGFGLRKFADLVGMQPSNLSALENGRRSPPTDLEKLREIAVALGLSEQSKEWSELFDAARRAGDLPADVRHVADRALVPALLRTINNCQLSDTEINNLMKEIESRYRR